jgi:hypothetical protein
MGQEGQAAVYGTGRRRQWISIEHAGCRQANWGWQAQGKEGEHTRHHLSSALVLLHYLEEDSPHCCHVGPLGAVRPSSPE